MSIKQTEGPQEDLLLLLPAATKWLSGDTYQSGTATVRRKVGLDLDTLAVNLTGEGLLLGEFTVNMEDTDGRGQTSHGRAKFKWALHDCVEEMEVHLPELKQSYKNSNNVESATSAEVYWGYEVLVHVLVATALWLYEEYA